MQKIKFDINDYKKEVEQSNKDCIAAKLCTKRLTEKDKSFYIENLKGLYKFSNLDVPKNIVFVSSPLLLAFAGGASRYYWNTKKNKDSATESAINLATESATDRVTYSATYSATHSASYLATESATYLATESSTDSATESATHSATESATYSATESATYSATNSATDSATDSSTHLATELATRLGTSLVTDSATDSSTDLATRSATYSATDSSTDSATRSATRSATYSATDSSTDSATRSATRSKKFNYEISTGVIVPENYIEEIKRYFKDINFKYDKSLLFEYIKGFSDVYQGGNNWASYDYYLDFYRRINKPVAGHDYTGFDYWFNLNIAGARILEKDFAMISEKPISIKIKGDLAHNLNGPAIEYMDGVKFYMAYGNFIPSWIVTTPLKEITKDMILGEENADYRRYLIERIGLEKYLDILGGATVVDTYTSSVGGTYELLEIEIDNEQCKYLKMQNQSEFVWHIEGVENHIKTCKQAIMYRNGMKSFKEPKFLS